MSNNKQSRIYQCVQLLSQGVNNLDIQNTIINAYEKVVRKNNALKEHIEKLVLDLQDKKKIISNLEKENISKDLLINKLGIEKFELYNKLSNVLLCSLYSSKHLLSNDDKFITSCIEENETLKETNKNLLEISKKLEEERDYYKLGSDNSRKCNESLRNENYKLKFEFDALKRERECSSTETKNLKEENEKLKQDNMKMYKFISSLKDISITDILNMYLKV